ncbi:alpha/beta hydrolase [Nakamurella flavida]|uniref:Alpha/beta hydrolase n=1 Tax=Nakamurella flavida TaxID=363630 RepID=A0A938YKF6_9ACTN|nr:alpha/beta hydrolase [Nakamurella flavida]MBM9476186.1 alpha/beta hydrolase [Nakamurella flavida]MDP9777069.1 pimeloyl-ACP methyl ester carboxylesterase [Nakamurella flavida]
MIDVDTRQVALPDGGRLVCHLVPPDPDGPTTGLTVVWHHGSPQTGAPLEPVVQAARARGIRLVSYGRPSYGGSTPRPGRDVASAASDVGHIADSLGLGRFAVMGASGGGPHALACAALLPGRITGVVTLAGLCPPQALRDWTAGMVAPGGLVAAAQGRSARSTFAETDEFDEASFVDADYAALAGPWAELGRDVGLADQDGPDGLIDDDVAFAAPWGFDLRDVRAPVLVVQGERDRVVPASHARALVDGCPDAQLWLRPADGHISVLAAVPVTLDWLLDLPR